MKHTIGAVVLGLALLASSGFAQPGPGDPGNARPGMRRHMIDQLKLTDQQKQDIGKLRAEFQKSMIAQRAKVQSLRVDLRSEIAADNPDRAAIEKTTQAISAAQSQMKMDLINHLFAVRALLTPEQQKIFKGELQQIVGRAHRGARFAMMGGMRGGMGNRMGGWRGAPVSPDDMGEK